MSKLVKGIIIAIIALVVMVALVLLGAGYYGWKAAQKAGNEAATIQNLKTIAAAQIQYYNTHNRTFGIFDQMIKESMLTSKFSGNSSTADGYVLTLKVTPWTSSHPASYTLNADPQSVNTGTNHFYIDSSTYYIHINPNQSASANDQPL
jgi:Tfp pilus assembly protein PilE